MAATSIPKRNEQGELPSHAPVGGYPIFYVTADNGVLCAGAECANGPESRSADTDCPDDNQWRIVAADIHWEGTPLICDHCGNGIDSAYGEPDAD